MTNLDKAYDKALSAFNKAEKDYAKARADEKKARDKACEKATLAWNAELDLHKAKEALK